MNGQLIMIDEFDKLTADDRDNISDAMEAGIVKVKRAASADLNTQTRLIATANPIDGKTGESIPLLEYNIGALAFKDMMSPYVIRRLDIGLLVDRRDINANVYYEQHKQFKPIVTPEMLKALIDRSWNVLPHNIEFRNLDYLYERIQKAMNGLTYASDIPLCEASVLKLKVARLAAAFANLFLSTNEDMSKTIVNTKQYDQAINFLLRIYGHTNCRLDFYSKEKQKECFLSDENYKEITTFIVEQSSAEIVNMGTSNITYDIIIGELVGSPEAILFTTLADITGASRQTIANRLKFMETQYLINRTSKGVKATTKLKLWVDKFKNDDTIENKEMFTYLKGGN
jgi:hypothetical protein